MAPHVLMLNKERDMVRFSCKSHFASFQASFLWENISFLYGILYILRKGQG